MRDGSDIGSVPEAPKISKWKRFAEWVCVWLEKRNKWGHTRIELFQSWVGLFMVIAAFGVVVYWFNEWDQQSREEKCEGAYATVPCLERLVKEAKAKEEYQRQLELIKNGQS